MNKNLYSVFKSLYLVSFEGCRSGLAERIYGAPYRHFSPYSRFPWRIESFLRLHDKHTIRSQSIYLLPHIPLYCLFLQTYFITEQKIINKTSIPVSSLGKKMDLVGLKKEQSSQCLMKLNVSLFRSFIKAKQEHLPKIL